MSKSIAGTPDASDSQQPQAAVGQGVVRRRRKANFSTEEVDILVREVASRRHVLFGMGQNGRSDVGNASAKATEKLAAWRAVAASVNSANRGESRTVREIRKKWENVTSTYRKRQMGDLGSAIELEPHILAGGRCPLDEVLACARAYQNNRMMHQQRRTTSAISPGVLETFHMDDSCNNRMREECTSSEEDLILDLQPDVQIESLETPLTFPDSDDMNSRTENMRQSNNHREQGEGASGVVDGGQDSSECEGGSGSVSRMYHGNRQLLQLQQQLRSGEVIISPALHQAHDDDQTNISKLTHHSPPVACAYTLQSNPPNPIESRNINMQNIEEQKLAVMRDILKIETKRLKIEKKRLKIEKIRLKMSQNVQ